jgi:hypothetical protein
MSENLNTKPLDAFERALSQFTPAPPSIDRDRLMFVAGQASTQYSVLSTKYLGRSWLWPAATTALAATSLALAFSLVVRPSPPPTIVHRDRPQSEPQASPASQLVSLPQNQPAFVAPKDDRSQFPATSTYFKERDVALRMGLDAIGSPAYSSQPADASTYRDLWLGFISATPSPDSAGDQTDKQTRM